MAGHSKWKNIREKKGKTDKQRGKIFTKISREIIVAVKEGGGSVPEHNARLKEAIAKARSANVPNDNIRRVIEKASGGGDNISYVSCTYEGYGPRGVAVIVHAMTDNRNRTAGEMRHYFDKYGGNLGTEGCVSWQFTRRAVLVIDPKTTNKDEDAVMLDALELGAEDMQTEGAYILYAPPDTLASMRDGLEQAGYTLLSAEVEMIPSEIVPLSEEKDVKNMEKLLDMLEDNDDVQNVYHNWRD